eukprot:gnl/Spiro4/8584_TR4498_c0_g1_i1.p2 gnl/Spiro4/8584_TR4498_c0_g1~~gnl/Spiro4/8584_TR4498_c0_g1_i1.p2  ORF type:complete len:243 (+),score=61.42 gnl/Spiro4/8584_TR4498_c0_g1_i1:71-799(+)
MATGGGEAPHYMSHTKTSDTKGFEKPKYIGRGGFTHAVIHNGIIVKQELNPTGPGNYAWDLCDKQVRTRSPGFVMKPQEHQPPTFLKCCIYNGMLVENRDNAPAPNQYPSPQSSTGHPTWKQPKWTKPPPEDYHVPKQALINPESTLLVPVKKPPPPEPEKKKVRVAKIREDSNLLVPARKPPPTPEPPAKKRIAPIKEDSNLLVNPRKVIPEPPPKPKRIPPKIKDSSNLLSGTNMHKPES